MRVGILLSRLDQTGMTANTLDLYQALKSSSKPTDEFFLIIGRPEELPSEMLRFERQLSNDPNVIYISLKGFGKNRGGGTCYF